jgi:hypothetical protein
MGVGLGYAIAAQVSFPNRRVICIQGDSAFGFRYVLKFTYISLTSYTVEWIWKRFVGFDSRLLL